jgi:hypothetical protein
MNHHIIDGKQMFLLDDIYTEEECKKFIEMLDKEEELEDIDRGFSFYKRNILISQEWADKVWKRIENLFDLSIRSKLYVNDHFRFSKYSEGQFFGIHTDGINQDSKGGRSVMTLNVFLNDTFEGGETDFLDMSKTLRVTAVPKPGRGAIFDRYIYHRGNVVRGGFKYLLRSDIMMLM